MNKVACFIFSYEITKGMKSFGPIGLLKANNHARELILHQIDHLNKIFRNPQITVVAGFGHEKLNKKIPKSVNLLINDEFATRNHGYALKLILSEYKLDNYDGIFIMNSGTIMKQLEAAGSTSKGLFNKSWIVSKNFKKPPNNAKFLGIINKQSGKVDYIFYDIGKNMWCESIYLCRNDIKKMAKSLNDYYDNMFLFEIINKSIVNHHIEYDEIVISQDSYVNITGIKDKSKIK